MPITLSFFVKKSCSSSSGYCVNVTGVDGSFGGRNSIRGPIFWAVELKSHQQHIVRPGSTLTHEVRSTLPRVSFYSADLESDFLDKSKTVLGHNAIFFQTVTKPKKSQCNILSRWNLTKKFYLQPCQLPK